MNDPGTILLVAFVKFALAMLLIGWIPALIARSKGRNFVPWWFYGGGFFLIALIHSLCIKSTNPELTEPSEAATRRPARNSGTTTWECDCGEINLAMATSCRMCETDKVSISNDNNRKVVGDVATS